MACGRFTAADGLLDALLDMDFDYMTFTRTKKWREEAIREGGQSWDHYMAGDGRHAQKKAVARGHRLGEKVRRRIYCGVVGTLCGVSGAVSGWLTL